MQMFRYWVVQLLHRVRSYLSLIISQCLDYKLIEKNLQINTFGTLQSRKSRDHFLSGILKYEYKCELINGHNFSQTIQNIWKTAKEHV